MSSGKVAAQSVHAALGLAQFDSRALDPMHSVVVLEASDKKFQEARDAKMFKYVVQDAGKTEVLPGTITVLAYLEE